MKSKYSELLKRKHRRNQQLVLNQQKIIESQANLILNFQQHQQVQLAKIPIKKRKGGGHNEYSNRSRSRKPRDKDVFSKRNKSTDIIRTDGLPLYESQDSLDLDNKPGPHLPRYQATELKRNKLKSKQLPLPSLHDKPFNG